jgi:hypothetical protein
MYNFNNFSAWSERMTNFVNCQQVNVSSINTAEEEASFNINHDADSVEKGHSAWLFGCLSISRLIRQYEHNVS